MKQIYQLITILFMAIAVTSCGDDFDYNPSLDNRSAYEVETVTFNDNNIDNIKIDLSERYQHYNNKETLKEYYETYFNEMCLLVWYNGKYEINEFVLREDTEPQKPQITNGKIRLNFKRIKHNESFSDKGFYFGSIRMNEVEENCFDCIIYDDIHNVSFSATVKLKKKF